MDIVVWNATTGAIALGILIILLRMRLPLRDRRFADVAPGVIPVDTAHAKTVPQPVDEEAPATREIPEIPMIEAGILLTGQTRPTHVAATVISMAAKGIVQLRVGETTSINVTAAEKASDPYERLLIGAITSAPSPTDAIRAPRLLRKMNTLADDKARDQRWFLRRGCREGVIWSKIGLALIIVLLTAIFVSVVASIVNPVFLHIVLPALTWVYTRMWPLLILLVLVLAAYALGLLSRDPLRRSATGRALTDRCEGISRYIADAQTSQMIGDKGVFIRYLPWAVLTSQVPEWIRTCSLIPGGTPPSEEVAALFAHGAKPEGTLSEALESFSTAFQR